MCGLVGIAGDYLGDKDKDIFSQLLLGNVLRGTHATGVAAIQHTSNGDTTIHMRKAATPSPIFLYDEGYRQILKENNLKAFIGHCRAKTIGENTDENAHPFLFKNVVGVHNGTLRDYDHRKEYDTDSEALYAKINEVGIKQAIESTTGAYALVFYDREKQTINFLRNGERPLWMAVSNDDRTIYWASEPGLLRWILNRNLIQFKIEQLKEDTLISFPLFKHRLALSIEASKLKMKEAYTRHVSPDAFFPPWTDTWDKALEEAAETTTETGKATTVGTTVHLPHAHSLVPVNASSAATGSLRENTALYQRWTGSCKPKVTLKGKEGWWGYDKEFIPKKEFYELLSKGCIVCVKVPFPNLPKRWVNRDAFLCHECKDLECFIPVKQDPPLVATAHSLH